MYMGRFFTFFFSSRRRHTRYIGDWSSDVCSSDLEHVLLHEGQQVPIAPQLQVANVGSVERQAAACGIVEAGDERSEERRVGKECRWRARESQCTKRSKSWRARQQRQRDSVGRTAD